MRPIQKVLMTVLWGLTVLIMVSVIGAGLWRKRLGEPIEPTIETAHAAPAFALIDQNEQPVTNQTLAGRPWIADFVFTNCAGPCPVMTKKLAGLQKELPSEVQLVSFSVDPEHDTPAVLKKYAKSFEADESRWRFLTGSKDTVYAVAAGMSLTAIPATTQSAIRHAEHFVLVDSQGAIHGYYSSNDPEALSKLKRDATKLAEKQ